MIIIQYQTGNCEYCLSRLFGEMYLSVAEPRWFKVREEQPMENDVSPQVLKAYKECAPLWRTLDPNDVGSVIFTRLEINDLLQMEKVFSITMPNTDEGHLPEVKYFVVRGAEIVNQGLRPNRRIPTQTEELMVKPQIFAGDKLIQEGDKIAKVIKDLLCPETIMYIFKVTRQKGEKLWTIQVYRI